MAVAIAIIVILALAVGTIIVLVGNRQRSNTGLLSRETKCARRRHRRRRPR